MAAGDVYRVVLGARLFSQYICNVLHFRARTAGTSALDLAGKASAWRQASMNLVQSNQYLNQQVDAYPVIPFGVSPATVLPTTPGGSINTDAMPPQVAFILRLKSDSTSRHMNGRIYIAAPGVGSLDAGGHLEVDEMTRLTTLANSMLAIWGPSGTQDYELGVWSRSVAGPAPSFNPAAFTPITHIFIPNVLYTQRRRTMGVGV